MKTCIIHVGMHKTGTTSIQKSLFDFEDSSFYYARIGGGPNHSIPVFNLFSENARAYKRSHRLTAGDMLRQTSITETELLDSFEAAGDRNMIISGEAIGVLKKRRLEALRNWLTPHFDAVSIIAYVRPPLGYMSSAFQQKVRGGAIWSLASRKLYRSYRGSFEKFDEVFGQSSVSLRLFERDALVQGDVVADFCATIGLELPAERAVKANESSPRDGICLRAQYNRYCHENGFVPSRGRIGPVLTAIDKLGSEKFRLSPLLLAPIVEANQQDIDWINARMGVNFGVDDGESGPYDITSEEDLLAPVPGAREVLLGLFDAFHMSRPPEDMPDGGLVHILSSAMGGKGDRRRTPDDGRKRDKADADGGGRGRDTAGRQRAAARQQRRRKASDLE